MKASRGVVLVALALLAVAAIRDVARLGEALPWRQLYDFADFYCAGAALDRGADPYRYEPLHRCEHSVNTTPAFAADPNRVIPAPLPPYDFPPFMLAARLRFPTARALDAAAIVVAVIASMSALGIVAGAFDVAVLALLLPAGYVLLNAGQIVPFALLALVLCGLALARGRPTAAGIAAALILTEPHLGLPVCVTLLFWAPRSRIGLLATAMILAIVALLTSGTGGIAEFLTHALPAQGSAESGYAYQYSLTYLLRSAGLKPGPAIFAGEISYVVMIAAGVWLGRRAVQRLGRPELLAYVPGACSVVAGPYVHMVDLPFAIPAALVFARFINGHARSAAAIAVVLLAVPWIPVWISKKLFLASLVVAAALLLRLRLAAVVAVVTFACIALTIYLLELTPPAPLLATTPNFRPDAFAGNAWSAYVAALGTPGLAWLIVKVPTWLALAGVFVAAAAVQDAHTTPAQP